MKAILNSAVRITFLTLLLIGGIYPLVVTGIGQVLFAYRANGSLIKDFHHRQVIGSELMAQLFVGEGYFHSRPSSAVTYQGAVSQASNYGPLSKDLQTRVAAELRLFSKNGWCPEIPLDLVTTSGSGLDPHISKEAALCQVPRIAKARKQPEKIIQALVEKELDGRDLGFLGEPHVNVLLLNIALDQRFMRVFPR